MARMFVLVLITLSFIDSWKCLKVNINLPVTYRNALKNNQKRENQQEIWITMNSDAAKSLSKSKKYTFQTKSISSSTNEANQFLLQVAEPNLPLINHIIHNKRRGFGDYVVHRSLGEANRFLARAQFGDQSVFTIPKIDNQRVVIALQRLIDSVRMRQFNQELVSSFRNRYYTSGYGYEASQWIKNTWTRIALPRDDITVASFCHSGFRQESIIATIKGSEKSVSEGYVEDALVIIGAHLDSINNYAEDNIMSMAPGADDNASGLSILTEVLKVIAASGYRPKKTIQLIGFAAEEVGLYGSGLIASAYRKLKWKVEGMLNFDMVGYKGRGKDIFISSDHTNPNLANFLAKLISTYLPNVTYGNMTKWSCFGCSDHAKWSSNDYPAAMVTAAVAPNDPHTFNPNYHSAKDLNVDGEVMKNFALLAVAYAAELAKGDITLNDVTNADVTISTL